MRIEFEAYRDKRNADLEREGHKPGSKWHVTIAHYPTWEASRAAVVVDLPQPQRMDDGWSGVVMGYEVDEVRTAIEAAGVKVKP